MAKVIVFGTRDTAELAHFYLTYDSLHDVVAFTVDRDFMDTDSLYGLPVVPFEDLARLYPPGEHAFIAPMTATRMNRDRQRVYEAAKAQGYEIISYVSSRATVFPGANIGENCFILEDNTIQPYVTIGNNVVLWSGNHIGHHSQIGDHVFFTSHVVLSGHCTVEPYCYLGVNATIRDYTRLAEGTFVGMAANVTKDTEPYGIYVGNPAKKTERPSLEIAS